MVSSLGAMEEEKRESKAAARLDEIEQETIDRQVNNPKLTFGYTALVRYAKTKEAFAMIVATVASIVAGATMPFMTVRFIEAILEP
jgi:ATP-binding cassette subfamily B (MDR/TAP) protein 1